MEKRNFLAEWHPQWGVLLAWPHPETDWADNLAQAEICYAQIVNAISEREHVLLLCHDAAHQAYIERYLGDSEQRLQRVHFVQCPYNDTHMVRNKRMQYHLIDCRKVRQVSSDVALSI